MIRSQTQPENRPAPVHALHQHDAPGSDFSTDRLLAKYGINKQKFNTVFERDVIQRTAAAIRLAVASPKPVTHLGLGKARIEKVASNRRIQRHPWTGFDRKPA